MGGGSGFVVAVELEDELEELDVDEDAVDELEDDAAEL